MMDVVWLRDLIICISGAVAVIVSIIVAVVVCLFYRRVKAALDSIETTTKNIQEVASTVKDQVIKPVAGLAIFVQGVFRGVNAISKFFRKK
ncbi:MAG: hypothetical protein J7L19_01180 [Dehalococcoidia bacterium]|nr:hypothetical protein [Dehalococcoidia bacterium]